MQEYAFIRIFTHWISFVRSFLHSFFFSTACNGDWGINKYPITPGHEIAGVVGAVGSSVTDFKVGDEVGVGCFISSCRSCDLCADGLEQHCLGGIQTYSTPFPTGKGENYKECEGYHTNGGYSDRIVVDEHFCFKVPESISLEVVGPLLCAGITTFSPLNRHILQKGGGKGKRVGVVGLGGLGHMAVKLAKAMGAEVTVLSRSMSKDAEAKALGADIMVHTDPDALVAAARTFDVIIDTVAVSHPVAPIVNTLKVGGAMVLLGGIPSPFELSGFALLANRYSVEGSLVGGMAETQQMLDFCAEHGVVPECKTIHAKDATELFVAMAKGESGAIRAVIDMSTLKDL
jgi:uncharacterized zinc-type alcohol dehydrogenase-like protein